MRSIGRILELLILTLLVTGFAISCRHKDIECPSDMRKIYIKFEWDSSPKAQVAGMTLFFYSSSKDGKVWRYEIAGRDGGYVELPPDHYTLIAINNDLPNISLVNPESIATLEAEMRRRTSDGVYASSGMLYEAIVTSLEVTPCGVRYTGAEGNLKECGKGIVRCYPDSIATQFSVRLNEVSGIEHIRSVEVRLEDIHTSEFLIDGRVSANKGTLKLGMEANVLKKMLSGSGCAFADNDSKKSYSMTLRVERKDGTHLLKQTPVGEEHVNLISPHHVLITVDSIEIPDKEGPDDVGGIDAEVEGWEVVNIEVSPTIQ